MKSINRMVLAVCVFVVASAAVFAQSTTEADALTAIKVATNPTTKLAAAEDFIAKFPNSTARVSVAEMIAGEILKVGNGAVALALLERAHAIFTSEKEREVLKPAALDAYVLGNRADDAFALAAEMLAKNHDDVEVLIRMTAAGIDQASKKDLKYADISLQYGLKAIALLEATTKPASVTEEAWTSQRGKLGQLYQHTGILYLAAGRNTQEAKARFTKASTLSPREPFNYALLARVFLAEYSMQNEAYDAMPEGKSKQEAQTKLDELLDSMIDANARAVALATGRVEYQSLLQSLVPELTNHYKIRHNQSTKGLQELINRYRPAP